MMFNLWLAGWVVMGALSLYQATPAWLLVYGLGSLVGWLASRADRG